MGLDAYIYTIDRHIVDGEFGEFHSSYPVQYALDRITAYMLQHHPKEILAEHNFIAESAYESLEDLSMDEVSEAATDAARKMKFYNPSYLYFRKFWPLHDAIAKLYSVKGGNKEFNCVEYRITEEDLDEIEKSIFQKPITDFNEFNLMMLAIKRMREAIDNNKALFYWAWY